MLGPLGIALAAFGLGDPAALAREAREHPGDPRRGVWLFADPNVGCLRCHKARGLDGGGDVGPDLSNVGGKLGRDDLIEAVLDPSRQVVEGYRTTVLAVADGRVFTGVVRGESPEAVTLAETSGTLRKVPTAEVEERAVLPVSLMPDGLAGPLTPEGFSDLVAYLQSLRAPGAHAPGSKVTLPPGFHATPFAPGITGATAMDLAPDGRLFVCEQTGALRVVGRDGLRPRPFATFPVDGEWERGLLGVALDPAFASNGWVYVFYVAKAPYPHHRLSRLTAAGDAAEPDSEVILFEGDDQRKLGGSVPAGHQGGAIHFGADGKLYAAVGDQTAAGTPSQSLDTLQGKLLRLNPDGSVPEDNPFAKTAKGKYRAAWALGLRNPYTFAVQPGTGRIFANDVGGNAEEVDEIVAGANYGWPVVEHGPTADRRFRGPVHHYPTSSITGGAFCPTDPAGPFPEALRGRYFFMDFIQGWVKTLDPDHPDRAEPFAGGLARPVDLKFAPDGTLFILLRDAWVRDDHFQPKTGSLLNVRYEPPAAGR